MMRSWAVFDSPIQNALHTLKYRRNIGLGESLAIGMAEFFQSLQWPVDIFIPVPLGKNRLKERGYNQVALVARPLAYEVGLQYSPRGTVEGARNTFTSGTHHFTAAGKCPKRVPGRPDGREA